MAELPAVLIRVVLGVIGFIVILSVLQFYVNIHPPKFISARTPEEFGIDYENISFVTSDKLTIRGWLLRSAKANGTVIVGHGYPFDKGNILSITTFLYPDYNLLFYDHRYFGESDGKISTVGLNEVKDVKAAVSFVTKTFPKQPISLYGFSLSASAMLMAQPDVKSIVADSPFADLDMMIQRTFSTFGPVKYPFVAFTRILGKTFFGVWPKDISPQNSVKNSTIPTFIIHGDKDSQIPVENSKIIQEQNKDIELWIVAGVDHGQAHALKQKEYEKRVKNFLKRHMNGSN